MSRSPAKSGKATATKSLKEKWLSMAQSTREKGENEVGGSSTITGTLPRDHLANILCTILLFLSEEQHRAYYSSEQCYGTTGPLSISLVM